MIKYSIIILLTLVTIWSCEEIPNGTIELETVDYTVVNISAPNLFVYSENNKIISTSITINKVETIKNVWFDITTINGLEIINSNNVMSSMQNGTKLIYSGNATIDENLLSGSYVINYYVEDIIRTSDQNVRKVGSKTFTFLSKAENFPPEINNLILLAEVNRNTRFSFSISASDPNGLSDIQLVYYELRDPSGKLINNSEGISKFPMFDDGVTSANGDITAGDGVFSVFLTFPSSVPLGNWTFTFSAEDKSGSKSNSITQIVKVN